MRERERVRYVEFVQVRYAALYRTAYLLTGNHHTAEDLLQTALTKVYLSWWRVRRVDGAESYARRVLVNEAVSLHRRRWTTEISSDRPWDLAPVGFQASHEDAVLDTQLVWQALAKLTAKQRAVIVLRYYEDLSEAQIAVVLGIAPGTVKGHARAALATMGAELPSERAVRGMRRGHEY